MKCVVLGLMETIILVCLWTGLCVSFCLITILCLLNLGSALMVWLRSSNLWVLRWSCRRIIKTAYLISEGGHEVSATQAS